MVCIKGSTESTIWRSIRFLCCLTLQRKIMSDPSPDVAGLIAEASQLQIFYSVVISATVLYFYDYALTLSTEISEIWNSKFSGAQALFFLTRYSFMVSMVVSIVSDFIPNPSAMVRVVCFPSIWMFGSPCLKLDYTAF
ncbi:hypothetical protein BD410DRAFT_508840 [Rickenella mellea]|uniref:DUF6533 domain-containing protein n=1 Tax=Rickenella mellea TaxID=50990 RepID=A0A4Y7PRM7_9AGAM|nr:hypothetical protein BD410DRAFT_508840 [Rickenella mellea]